ncbi:MAG: hypothetical protein IJC78_07140 [Clostridia bacterium]|nr:hypothetical protein [Clostridia bacterium]
MKRVLSVMLVAICILLCSCGNAEIEKAKFQSPEVIEEYILAEYETYNSPAKENGLGGTKIYIDGVFNKVSDDAAIYAMLNDGEHNWSICFGTEPEWTLDDVKIFEGQRVRVFGIYTGFSGKFHVPTVLCVKFTLADTGECHHNIEFAQSLKPLFEGFEDGAMEEDENQPTSHPTEDAMSAEGKVENAKLLFELEAGKPGDYGKMITYNKGTEFEENIYAFYVPVGTYTVTNVGTHMSQINVYSDEIIKNDDGWEEPAEAAFVKLLDVNQSEVVIVEKGQHIEIEEPSRFRFEQQ